MRTFLALGAVMCVVLVGAGVALVLQVLPYVIMGMVVGAVIRRRQRRPESVHRAAPVPLAPRPLAPGRWAYVPVWVGPPPQRSMPVIEAELIRDPHDG
jgi:hypothetical protein